MNPAENPAAVGTWLIVAFAIATGVGTLLQIIAFFRPKPANHEVYATKSELDRLEQRIASENRNLHGRISGLRDDLTKSGEERAERILHAVDDLTRTVRDDTKGLHNRITAVVTSVAHLEGKISKKG